MKSIEEIRRILTEQKNYLIVEFKVKDLGIFGSYLRNEQSKTSDIDILVEFYEPIGFFKFLELEEYLESQLGIKVDLVSKKALKPRIGKYILKELVIV